MCWKIENHKYFNNPEKYHKISEEDIVVYKFGWENDGKFFPSYYPEFGYEPNSINDKVSLKVIKEGRVCIGTYYNYIDEGYHSYSRECGIINSFNDIGVYSKNDSEKNLDYYDFDDPFIGKFIIPKGSEYYENEDGEIVSSNIIWTGQFKYITDINIESFAIIRLKDIDYVLE